MATLLEHALAIRAAVQAARDDGFRVVLEEGSEYQEAYVDLEEHVEGEGLVDWDSIIEEFD